MYGSLNNCICSSLEHKQKQTTKLVHGLVTNHALLKHRTDRFHELSMYFSAQKPTGNGLSHLNFFNDRINKCNNLVYRLLNNAPVKPALMHEIHYQNLHTEIKSTTQKNFQTDLIRETLLKKLIYILNTIIFSQKIIREQVENYHNLLHRIAITQQVIPGYHEKIRRLDLNYHGDKLLHNGLGLINGRRENVRDRMSQLIEHYYSFASMQYRALQHSTKLLFRHSQIAHHTAANFKHRVVDLESGLNLKIRQKFERNLGIFVNYNSHLMLNSYRTKQKTREMFKKLKMK
jgi:hypothetical protein